MFLLFYHKILQVIIRLILNYVQIFLFFFYKDKYKSINCFRVEINVLLTKIFFVYEKVNDLTSRQ